MLNVCETFSSLMLSFHLCHSCLSWGFLTNFFNKFLHPLCLVYVLPMFVFNLMIRPSVQTVKLAHALPLTLDSHVQYLILTHKCCSLWQTWKPAHEICNFLSWLHTAQNIWFSDKSRWWDNCVLHTFSGHGLVISLWMWQMNFLNLTCRRHCFSLIWCKVNVSNFILVKALSPKCCRCLDHTTSSSTCFSLHWNSGSQHGVKWSGEQTSELRTTILPIKAF